MFNMICTSNCACCCHRAVQIVSTLGR